MSIVASTGNHPRHCYLVNELFRAGLLSGWVSEIRAEFVPKAPAGLSGNLTRLFDLHFRRRQEAEELLRAEERALAERSGELAAAGAAKIGARLRQLDEARSR